MNWKWQAHGVARKVLALAGNDPPTKHMLMCGLATSKSVPGKVRGCLGWQWDLSCHPSIKLSRKYTWVDGDSVHFPLISKHFRKALFFFLVIPVTCNVLIKEERPCTSQVLTLEVNQALLELLLLQINHAAACITMCDYPHPSTTLSCLQFWLYLTVFVKCMLGLALNISHTASPMTVLWMSVLYSRKKWWHAEAVDVTPPVTRSLLSLLCVGACALNGWIELWKLYDFKRNPILKINPCETFCVKISIKAGEKKTKKLTENKKQSFK